MTSGGHTGGRTNISWTGVAVWRDVISAAATTAIHLADNTGNSGEHVSMTKENYGAHTWWGLCVAGVWGMAQPTAFLQT